MEAVVTLVTFFCLQDEKNQILIASIWLNLVSQNFSRSSCAVED